ncbi:NAD(P)/FAD-dependent oxidoreductase|uniref:L-2-hydroxyglutarate oxidase LhgO n=1 Tax=Dendrosporobacter quercicolus TaxID=146817 RepID=A0A1G9U449_9FIRM|nr:NAD(P)/FAD-dependent oxidoreductase [Dendrosporobacter quercicolus]NSL48765.1 NAD(P)/FAD-dependent oxidoreductase [Dendrosporobacter quercicolus DSM 1736]SDM54603.1 L-2-hydroxyglutarate oxidase LhgO [Dendrosporobacter quercicolus]
MDQVDIVIIGAGIVGLAAAYELALRWPDKSILLLEQAAAFGRGLSGRTSEVIHSGAYYPPGSLKARLCVSGNKLLYEFCRREQVPHRRLGKLIIARDDDDLKKLESLLAQAAANGVPEAGLINVSQLVALEPGINARAAILCPSSGIVDSHRLMAMLAYRAEACGAMLVYRHEVTGLQQAPNGGFQVTFQDAAGTEESIGCQCLINAAGLGADRIAAMAGIDIDETGYRIYRCKGEYFAVNNRKAKLVTRLVFPVSIRELKGSGIPVIKDLQGRMRLGPDAHYASSASADYTVQPANARLFFQLVQGYLPFLQPDDLQPDLAALRPRLQTPCGSPPRDFLVKHEVDRGLTGLVNLIGIESPGITCCLSLAQYVGDLLEPVAGKCHLPGRG